MNSLNVGFLLFYTMRKILIIAVCATFLISCNSTVQKSEKYVISNLITDAEDYNQFLASPINSKNDSILKEDLSFWQKKLENDSNNFIAMFKTAQDYEALFNTSGKINYLIMAEDFFKKANSKTKHQKSGYLRAIAKNQISQHKFKEALDYLLIAKHRGEGVSFTEKMLFDVHLELGNSDSAEHYLSNFKNLDDFTYLIRVSKWNDHEGNLEMAIEHLEKATKKAEDKKNEHLMAWCYTNLADYYGHAGEIKKSYQHYLKALKINSSNAYAKKGIAWIVYSKERNHVEALRILDNVIASNQAPDYHLLKAEILEHMGMEKEADRIKSIFLNKIQSPAYGDMYNKYLIDHYAADQEMQQKAMQVAKVEVNNRKASQSYALLAKCYLANGMVDSAYNIATTKVYQKTFEPEQLLSVAKIAKAKNDTTILNSLLPELKSAIYELGPVAENEISQL